MFKLCGWWVFFVVVFFNIWRHQSLPEKAKIKANVWWLGPFFALWHRISFFKVIPNVTDILTCCRVLGCETVTCPERDHYHPTQRGALSYLMFNLLCKVVVPSSQSRECPLLCEHLGWLDATCLMSQSKIFHSCKNDLMQIYTRKKHCTWNSHENVYVKGAIKVKFLCEFHVILTWNVIFK